MRRIASNLFGATLIVCVNGFTDTPQSIGQLAAYVKANSIPGSGLGIVQRALSLSSDFFATATAYLDKMKPYRDAIKAVDPNAIIAIFARDPGNSAALNAWDTALAAYPNKYWDAITFHHYPPQSSGNFAQWMADESAVLVNKTTTVVTNQLTPIGPPGVKFLNTEFDSTIRNEFQHRSGLHHRRDVVGRHLCGRVHHAYVHRALDVACGPKRDRSLRRRIPHERSRARWNRRGQRRQTDRHVSLNFGFYIGAQASRAGCVERCDQPRDPVEQDHCHRRRDRARDGHHREVFRRCTR